MQSDGIHGERKMKMRKKLVLLLLAALLLSLEAPAAQAGSNEPRSPERKNGSVQIQSDSAPLPELPTAEIYASVISNSSGTAVMQVAPEQLMQAVETVAGGDAVSITITLDGGEGASSVSAAIPKDALAAVVDQTDAEISVVSPLGQVTLSNTTIAPIIEQAGEADITVTMTRGASGARVNILSGEKEITGWNGEGDPAAVSPLAVQTEAVHSGVGNVRRYAAYICLSAAVLVLAGSLAAGVLMKRRQNL